ncbi:MAG: hypothetical protein C0596_11940 [Marinilabiliales bacterium]|nr:MAG: hypothetical protein C0596_11940 [Marinilabiliales bacterium]
MKKNLVLIAILSLVIFACGPIATTETAVEYNDEMIDVQTDVDQALVDLLDEIDLGDEESILDAQDEALKVIKDAEKKVDEMDDFDGKDDYKKAMKDLLKMYKDIVENELTEVIDYTIYYDDLTDDEWDYFYELYDSALEKYEEAFDEFTEFQKDFAEEWDFVLE